MQSGKPLLVSRKRAVRVLSPADSKKRKVATKSHSDQVLEACCSTDIEDTACFTTTEIEQVRKVLSARLQTRVVPTAVHIRRTPLAPAGSAAALKLWC